MKKIALLVTFTLLLFACQTVTPSPTPSPADTPAATATVPSKTATPSPTVTLTPIEKPDEATFKAYFNELYLTNAPTSTIFKTDDKICPILDIKKGMQGSASIYDPIKRTETLNKEFRLDRVDVFQFCQFFGTAFTSAPGKYELRFRVNDQIVAVWPVQVQTTEIGMPALPEYPNAELFQEYFNSIIISNMQPTTVFATSDRVAVYIDAKKDLTVLNGNVFEINKQAYLLAQKINIATLHKPGIAAIFFPPGSLSTMIPGKYAFKFWVGDTLVEILPFEVQ